MLLNEGNAVTPAPFVMVGEAEKYSPPYTDEDFELGGWR
jgi:hypothetical protein